MSAGQIPRFVAARVTVQAVATMQRVVAAVGALITATLIIDVMLARGLASSIPLVVSPMLGIAVLALVLLWRPGVLTAVLYVLGGSVLSAALIVLALQVDATLNEPGPYVLNRAATAVVLVGAVGSRAISGVLWTVAAFVAAQTSLTVGFALVDPGAHSGVGPIIVFSISLLAYATLAVAQSRTERQLESLDRAERELRQLDQRRALERRAAGVVHDTLLSDLVVLSQRTGSVDTQTRELLTRHLSILETGTVARTDSGATTVTALYGDLLDLARDSRRSGVNVDLSGVEALDGEMPTEVRNAVRGAVQAALDNVARHARTSNAEVVAGIREGRLLVIVVDDGVGFAADSASGERLGMRTAITDRIEQVGGSVRVWSGDEGTTVMLSVPIMGEAS